MTTKLYVGNLPEVTKEKELKDLFQSFGDVTEVAVLRGYGFVHFSKTEDASTALDSLDGSEFMRSRLLVQFARTKGHGYGRGSGPPRPRGPPPRGNYRDFNRRNEGGSSHRDGGYRDRDSGGYRDGGRDSYRDGGRDSGRDSYRDSGRDSYRDGGRDSYHDGGRDGLKYGSRDYGHRDHREGHRDRGGRDYDRSSGNHYGDRDKGYDRYDNSSYTDDGGGRGSGGRYSDYRAKSRSPGGGRDYYKGYGSDSYKDDGYHKERDRRW